MKHKVVLNDCYGGFGLSQEALNWIMERDTNGELSKYIHRNPDYKEDEPISLFNTKYFCDRCSIPRHHPLLVECVETLGKEVNTYISELSVVEINENQYHITEYDGVESIITPSTHQIPWITIE